MVPEPRQRVKKESPNAKWFVFLQFSPHIRRITITDLAVIVDNPKIFNRHSKKAESTMFKKIMRLVHLPSNGTITPLLVCLEWLILKVCHQVKDYFIPF